MLRNKQVITGKKQTRKQKQNVKNDIKNGRSAGRERRSCYTTQADRFYDKLSMKKANKNHKNLRFFLSSRDCLYRTKDYILLSEFKHYSVCGAFSCKRTISMTVL